MNTVEYRALKSALMDHKYGNTTFGGLCDLLDALHAPTVPPPGNTNTLGDVSTQIARIQNELERECTIVRAGFAEHGKLISQLAEQLDGLNDKIRWLWSHHSGAKDEHADFYTKLGSHSSWLHDLDENVEKLKCSLKTHKHTLLSPEVPNE